MVFSSLLFYFATQSAFKMNLEPQNDLQHIRQMMERSTKFMSLSGLSGVAAGVVALISCISVYLLLKANGIVYFYNTQFELSFNLTIQLLMIAVFTILLALLCAFYFTWKKSKSIQQAVWTSQTKRLLLHLILPLKVGGIFCIALCVHHQFILVAPSTLVFYGLALISVSKFTYGDIFYLGLVQLGLGLLSLFLLGYGLLFWALGFGVMHVIYGTIMYLKYDKKAV